MAPSPSETRAGYLGFVAHEFRNPLATALWCTEILQRIPPEERAGARGARLLTLAHRALRRMSSLVEDHLLAERLELGGIPVRPEPVALRAALAAAAERAIPGETLDLAVPEAATVQADRALLEQLLGGLLATAAAGGTAARAELRGPSLVISGAPAAPEALEPPQKGSPASGRPRPLALLMARAAARAQGLELRVDREALVLDFPGGG